MSSGDSGDIDLAEILFHPEVELRMKVLGNEWGNFNRELITSLDILEVYPGMAGIVWNKSAYILFAKFESPKIYFTCA
jgi:hypothetical protein